MNDKGIISATQRLVETKVRLKKVALTSFEAERDGNGLSYDV